MSQEITKEQIAAFDADFSAQRANRVAMNAVTNNGLLASAIRREAVEQDVHEYSISLEQGEICNQKQSGRCWMFSTLNVLRQRVIAKCDLEDFSFSPTYLAFYDKLEKANLFLENILHFADQDLTDRETYTLLGNPLPDGGQWDMAISLIKKVRRGQFMDALWEEVTWWVVFAGIGLMAAGMTSVVLYVGLAMVVLGPVLTNKGFGKITGIFGSLYNHITGYFGDILSYSRLMALMLAGSVIAQVFNTLGAIPGNIIVFLIISLAGNALNFALNLLGCYVHDLRLQCLEYFGKFYEDGGKPFKPLMADTKYVDITK